MPSITWDIGAPKIRIQTVGSAGIIPYFEREVTKIIFVQIRYVFVLSPLVVLLRMVEKRWKYPHQFTSDQRADFPLSCLVERQRQ